MNTITIYHPVEKTEIVLGQAEFNKYMSMTNGEVMEWVVSAHDGTTDAQKA